MILGMLMAVSMSMQAKQVTIQTKNTTMVLEVENGKQPQYVYYGAKLSDYDLAHLQTPRNGRMDAYPAYGMNCPAEAALAMKHADGNMSTEMIVRGMETKGDVTRITLSDPIYPTTVTLCYKAYQDEDMIETWTEIQNGEAKPVTSRISMVPGPTKPVWWKSLSCLARRSSRIKTVRATRIRIMRR